MEGLNYWKYEVKRLTDQFKLLVVILEEGKKRCEKEL